MASDICLIGFITLLDIYEVTISEQHTIVAIKKTISPAAYLTNILLLSIGAMSFISTDIEGM